MSKILSFLFSRNMIFYSSLIIGGIFHAEGLSEELKQIVSLYEEDETIKKFCIDYNISKSSLYNWIHDYSKVKTQGKFIFTGRQVYLLQKELALLKEDYEILKQCFCSVNSPISLKNSGDQ